MKFRNIFTPCYCYDEKTAAEVQHLSKESGFDRVKRMYQLNEYNLMSPEMFYLLQNIKISVGFSAVVGGIVHAGKVREDYFRRNVAATYESEYLAKRNLTDTISLAAFKGGYKYAVKYGSFSTIYLLSTMTVANYNNKITIWEHIGTGALLGGLLRFNFGLKGMAASASVGAFLGTLGGGILVLYMKFNNITLDDIHDMQSEKYYAMKKAKNAEK